MGKVEYTREKIKNTFFELLENKRFEDITLKELLEKAQISKTTFYRYYKDMSSILDSVISKDIEEFHKKSNMEFRNNHSEMLEFVQKKRKIIHNIVNSKYNDLYFRNILCVIRDLSKKYVFIEYDSSVSAEEKERIAERIEFEMFGRFANWVLSGMKEDLSNHIEPISNAQHSPTK